MRTKLLFSAAAAVLAVMLLPLVSATTAGAGAPDPNRATVGAVFGPYGQTLVVGGAGAGWVAPSGSTPGFYLYPPGSSLYVATIDPPTYTQLPGQTPYQAGCLTTVVTTHRGPLSCTGAETDHQADWPTLTTDKPPISGRGADPRLLSSVYRSDLGTYQVTYAGSPLYLFDPGPHSYFGANFYETVSPLPPWHTAWFLMNRNGLPATGPATIETEAPVPGSTTYDTTKLAVEMLPTTAPGGVAVSAYQYSSDTTKASHCYVNCQILMIPVYTVGAPIAGMGVNPASIGTITRPNGAVQVTYNGLPLYIYNQEQPVLGAHGPSTTGTVGNGDGVTFRTGTFSLVNP